MSIPWDQEKANLIKFHLSFIRKPVLSVGSLWRNVIPRSRIRDSGVAEETPWSGLRGHGVWQGRGQLWYPHRQRWSGNGVCRFFGIPQGTLPNTKIKWVHLAICHILERFEVIGSWIAELATSLSTTDTDTDTISYIVNLVMGCIETLRKIMTHLMNE